LKDLLKLTENAKIILEKRYLIKDKNNNPAETFQDMFWRVAFSVAEGDLSHGAGQEEIKKTAQKFYNLLINLDFLPNSPTLMNAGREIGQLCACFVLPVEDSLDDIFETVKNTALIHKSGGGTGFSFSRLRPKNDAVKSAFGVSAGPVSFIEVFNSATEVVKQGGVRRGGNMAVLRVDHPDIKNFISCKDDRNKLINFNISVGITDEFMRAVNNKSEYNIIHPKTGKVLKKQDAFEILRDIAENAWKNGEPGIIFLDTINKYNPTPALGQIESTNPCGEVPLLPYEACNHGSINLSNMLKNASEIDWDRLKNAVSIGVHFMDNIININKYPLKQTADITGKNRKIGLGVMGLGDFLMKLNIPYSSAEAIKTAGQIIEFIDYWSKVESVRLSKERGRFFNFENSIYDSKNYLFNKFKGKSSGKICDEDWRNLDESIQKYGIRNATTTCIAPTGTISLIAATSGGIEPVFALVYKRIIIDGPTILEVNPVFENLARNEGFYSEELMQKIYENGSLNNLSQIPENIKKVFITAHDISPEWHVKMQATFQLHTDNAVSKTVNFAEHASVDDVIKTCLMAYNAGLKGITVYRDNSRNDQVMLINSSD
jgi:ribonucleoside-diphosphate reductase alpha chain